MPDPTTQSVVVQPSAAPTASSVFVTISSWATGIVAIAALVALLVKLLTREVGREVETVKRDVADVHRVAEKASGDIAVLTQARTTDVERIVRLEVAMTGIEKGFDRIDQRIAAEFGQLSQSIREIRNVAPRGAA